MSSKGQCKQREQRDVRTWLSKVSMAEPTAFSADSLIILCNTLRKKLYSQLFARHVFSSD
jgi:hypothetical protein